MELRFFLSGLPLVKAMPYPLFMKGLPTVMYSQWIVCFHCRIASSHMNAYFPDCTCSASCVELG